MVSIDRAIVVRILKTRMRRCDWAQVAVAVMLLAFGFGALSGYLSVVGP